MMEGITSVCWAPGTIKTWNIYIEHNTTNKQSV